jgi:hypothetical protein
MEIKKNWLISILLLTSLTGMGGCSFFQGGEEAATPEAATTPAPAPPTATAPPPFEKPTQPGAIPVVSVLTPATDPNARGNVVLLNSNPFMVVPKPTRVAVDPEKAKEKEKEKETKANQVPSVAPLPNTPNNAGASTPLPNPNAQKPATPSIPKPSGSIPTLPPLVFTPNLPTLPQPTLAQGVQVTGLITIGNQTKIIVKAPNEPFSRYVRVGETLSDGQVLVKRIEGQERGVPVVILEQAGIEVRKRVEAPTNDASGSQPPAPPSI